VRNDRLNSTSLILYILAINISSKNMKLLIFINFYQFLSLMYLNAAYIK